MPHLSEIQKKYAGKVRVIGVNIWEERGATDNTFHTKIDKYLEDMGDKMVYDVAADGWEGKVAKAWMEASEGGGIPTAFIVGKDGTILWIGHPMAGMDEAIDQILAGKYDLAAATAKDAARRKIAKSSRETMGPIRAALNAKDFPKAIELIDQAVAKDPDLALNLGMLKYNVLLSNDPPKAMEWAKSFSEGAGKNDPNVLNALAWSMVDDRSTVKDPDYALAVKIAERGVSLLKEGDPFAPYLLDTLAYALFKNGKLDRAIEVQSKAVAAAESTKDMDPATLKEIRDRLELFKKKKSGGG